jgi:hypothetical protein
MRQQGAGSEEGVDPGMLGLWEAAVFWHEARLQHPWRLPSAVALSLTALGRPFSSALFFAFSSSSHLHFPRLDAEYTNIIAACVNGAVFSSSEEQLPSWAPGFERSFRSYG